jgi:shikimate dehydrogenase
VNLLGACNTLKNVNGKITASVTDSYGFIESLGGRRTIFNGAGVVLLGAGGGARSVVYALSRLGVQKLFISDVVFERSLNLSQMAMHDLKLADVTALSNQDPALNDAVAESTILINASPVGMHPDVHSLPFANLSVLTEKHFVYDLVYNPGMTKLLQEAQARGAAVQNGLDMLIFQGLQSLRIWHNEGFQLQEAALNELAHLMKAELES